MSMATVTLEVPESASAAEDAEVAAVLEACRDDPALFNDAVLGRTLWKKQIDICDTVAVSPITVVPAGRAIGKSYLLAGLVIWWLYTRKNSLVITTGPDYRQVVSVLWKEIRRAILPKYVDGVRVSPLLDLKWDHMTEGYASTQRLTLDAATAWGALGYAANSSEGFSGQHAGEMLVIVDEASGVTDEIWTSIHGLAATRLVVSGNPIRYDCHFRELYELAPKSTTIRTVHISSLECPDADLETSPVGMASRSFLRQMREIHGENSPWWRSNILGEFPGKESVRFIDTSWIDACTNPAIVDDELWNDMSGGNIWMGVDVGGGVGADRSVVVVRNHKQLLDCFASADHGVLDDAKARLEPIVVAMAAKWKVPADRVIYDKAGLGRSFGSYLANHGLGGAVGYFGGGRGGIYYSNRRTANAYAVKRRLDPRRDGFIPFYVGGIPEWLELRHELAEMRAPTMEMDEGVVKQKLEDKEELKSRLHRSPDILDAFLMTFTYSE